MLKRIGGLKNTSPSYPNGEGKRAKVIAMKDVVHFISQISERISRMEEK